MKFIFELDAISPKDDDAELRCHCGSLLARLVDGGVELKCRRCRRTVVVPLVVEDERPPG